MALSAAQMAVGTKRSNPVIYGRFLILIAGLGGLLYGIDVGIIAAALLYLGKTVSLTVAQTSMIVAAVLGGSTISSLIGGFLADWLGRKRMMIGSGLLFVVSVGMIVSSHGFVLLLLGRLLQGVSGGVIAVVVPLYLAECLSAKSRGQGSAIFQFMLTVGIVVAALTGLYYTTHAEAAIAAAAGNQVLIYAAENHAWRGMFLSVIYPGFVFFLGAFFLSESPRWLFRKGRKQETLAALRRSSSEEDAQLQFREMEELAAESQEKAAVPGATDSLLRRKYVFPFLLACVILACNQATGINSILAYLVLILRQAGMSAAHSTQGDFAVKLLNCVMTIVAVALIDRRGRKFLLTLGTAGIVVALTFVGFSFHRVESQHTDVKAQMQAAVKDNALTIPISEVRAESGIEQTRASVLTVLYSYGDGERVASVLSDDKDPVLRIEPETKQTSSQSQTPAPLIIERATCGPVPSGMTGWLITVGIALFIASYSVGPGVVVWLTLSELMPTRIRSAGMGIALLLNQGVSTLIAGIFLPVVGHHGYYAMFLFWAGCTVVYFVTAAFFLPETKGKTLEEIERYFDADRHAQSQTT
ncbi:sugar porter family MFS transporter [Edaphobacter bradus]|uniref:sugar porter family MFS transporter n=1 Tax=Edaphobacter bradus TaxID=2259016 RepID=UPI0021DFDA5F|nr:sugar porter family MFS transporter [Edaphobacter bradus]